jgi:hypothetical protein
MKRLMAIGFSLLALLALGAIAATIASAVEGILPLNKKGITMLGTKVIFEDTSGKQLKCATVTGTGTMTSDIVGTVTLDFHECESAGLAEFSLGEKETTIVKEALVLASVELTICLINPSTLTFGVFVKLREPIHTHIKAAGILLVYEGAFIGEITTKKGRLLVTVFKGEKGKPAVTACKDEAGGVKAHSLTVKTNEAATLSASSMATGSLLQLEEEVELMDK